MRNRVAWQQVLDNFHVMLEGKADDYYWELIRNSQARGNLLTWEGLRTAFVRRFQQNASELEIMREIMDMRQGRDESFDTLYSRFSRIHNRLSAPLEEWKIVELLRASLREETAQTIGLMQIEGVDHLRYLVARAEKLMSPKRSQWGNVGRNVSEIATEPTSLRTPAANQGRTSNWLCWNCDERGHGFMDCNKERRLFCYRCGEKEVTCLNCPRCKRGNRRASGNRPGRPRLQTSAPGNQDVTANPPPNR